MTNQLDVLALATEIEQDSQSGSLSCELIAKGQVLYGKNPQYPEFLERITPDGKKSLGLWRNREFEEVISLL
jgi:hypothetical protein